MIACASTDVHRMKISYLFHSDAIFFKLILLFFNDSLIKNYLSRMNKFD